MSVRAPSRVRSLSPLWSTCRTACGASGRPPSPSPRRRSVAHNTTMADTATRKDDSLRWQRQHHRWPECVNESCSCHRPRQSRVEGHAVSLSVLHWRTLTRLVLHQSPVTHQKSWCTPTGRNKSSALRACVSLWSVKSLLVLTAATHADQSDPTADPPPEIINRQMKYIITSPHRSPTLSYVRGVNHAAVDAGTRRCRSE